MALWTTPYATFFPIHHRNHPFRLESHVEPTQSLGDPQPLPAVAHQEHRNPTSPPPAYNISHRSSSGFDSVTLAGDDDEHGNLPREPEKALRKESWQIDLERQEDVPPADMGTQLLGGRHRRGGHGERTISNTILDVTLFAGGATVLVTLVVFLSRYIDQAVKNGEMMV